MSRSKERADRIRAKIPILDVLASYGYHIHSGVDREQQFSCDLHGDGTDSKPSARAYPNTNQWYCFACATSRDAIQTVREKEGLDFHAACSLLEKRFGLPPLPWVDEDKTEQALSFEAPVATAHDAKERVTALLRATTQERSLSLGEILRLWEEHDKLATLLEKNSEGLLDEFLALRDRTARAVRASSGS